MYIVATFSAFAASTTTGFGGWFLLKRLFRIVFLDLRICTNLHKRGNENVCFHLLGVTDYECHFNGYKIRAFLRPQRQRRGLDIHTRAGALV